MKFLLAPDSFKESMTAKEVCQAMEKGIKNVLPNAQIIAVPMADGGEGTTA
ncbi:glycerate kinase, partial [Lactobacillus acetotolerans]